jgi:hypothetical protein
MRAEQTNRKKHMTMPYRDEGDRLDEYINVRFKRAQFEAINAAAQRHEQRVSAWVRQAVFAALKREAEVARRKAQRAAA